MQRKQEFSSALCICVPLRLFGMALRELLRRSESCVSLRAFAAQAVLLALVAAFPDAASAQTNTKPTVIVVSGAPGEDEFGKVFVEAAANWRRTAETAGVHFVEIGVTNQPATNDLGLLTGAITAAPTNSELWIVLIGHGTFDGRDAKFNLRGPDLSAAALSNLLAGTQRPVAIIHAGSSSAPFIKSLSGRNRVVVTATRSGSEENYARFNRFVSEAIADRTADLDKDGQTSLLEAFLMASRRVEEFYKAEGRLATEHALIDDNGDGFGTQADWFRGIHAVKKAAGKAALDGMRAHQWHLVRSTQDLKLTPEQRRQRDALELEIGRLREQKASMSEDAYYNQLEALLTKFAVIELGTNASPAK